MYVCIRFSPCNMRIFSFRDSVFVEFEVGGIIGSQDWKFVILWWMNWYRGR